MDSSKKRPLIDPTSPAGVGIKKVAKALGKIPDSYEIPDKEAEHLSVLYWFFSYCNS